MVLLYLHSEYRSLPELVRPDYIFLISYVQWHVSYINQNCLCEGKMGLFSCQEVVSFFLPVTD